MNSLGLNLILRMGCICTKERIVINGRSFYVRERLGQGGFSVVELIEDSKTHEEFALKRIICHSPEDQRIALSEVEVHRIVQHPNVLELVDYDLRGKTDPLNDTTSQVLIVLPYFHKGTLAGELERREKQKRYLEEKEVLRLFQSICDAVAAFHNNQPHALAHRDLKTANILLSDSYAPVLMDLGSVARARVEVTNSVDARKLEEIAAERSSMPYRAPELFNIPSQTMIDERTDIWSLGCVLFALCFFKSPYDIVYERGDSVNLAVVSGRLDIPPDSPFSEGIHDMIRYLLVVEPKERPFIQDVMLRAKQLEAKAQGCV
ncbi:unnamed protein product [Allacma fusca]|uniref:non-specific serine/threonine protein kinase n=1 Tax=Allacma fusca TaxID=39272 RepID=A0A8J2P1U3_9HEXA|nr:unnamed protein product [Allacma fusca]